MNEAEYYSEFKKRCTVKKLKQDILGETNYTAEEIENIVRMELANEFEKNNSRENMNHSSPSTSSPTERPDIDTVSAAAHANIKKFIEDLRTNNLPKAIPTGFPRLDNEIFGLLSGLTVLAAESNTGKSTLALQTAAQIAKQDKKVVFFSLEMSAKDMYLKLLANESQSLYKPKEKRFLERFSAIGAKQNYEEHKESIEECIEIVDSYFQNIDVIDAEILNSSSIEKITDLINQYAEVFNKNNLVVILDYLQYSKAEKYFSNSKENLDFCIHELKICAIKNQVPVICISSVNRANYNQGPQMQSVKGSGDIEYSADLLLYLKDEGLIPGSDSKKLNLTVLKNRLGKKDISIELEFTPKTGYFNEIGLSSNKEEKSIKWLTPSIESEVNDAIE